MIILSQDNEKVIKRVINFDNIVYLGVDKININYSVIIFKDATMDDNKLEDYNCVLGVYDTEERAKEVLQEIIKCYGSYLQLDGGPAIIQGQVDIQPNIFNIPKVYKMPEK